MESLQTILLLICIITGCGRQDAPAETTHYVSMETLAKADGSCPEEATSQECHPNDNFSSGESCRCFVRVVGG